VQDGALTAEPIEHFGDLEPIHFVDGDVPHRLQQSLRPDGAGNGPDEPLTSVDGKLQTVHQPRRTLGQRFGTLDDQAARGNVDDPALVTKTIQVLNGGQIHLSSQAETTLHAFLPTLPPQLLRAAIES
jgi:hypothetical protein